MIRRIIPVLAIFFLVVTVALGTYQYKMFLFGDTDLTYHFGKSFFSFEHIYIWNDYFKAGIFDFDKFQAFYLKKLIFAVNSVTSFYFFSYLWYFLPIFLYILSFYFLLQEVQKLFFKENKFICFNALLISLFAGVNGIFVLYYGQVLVILSLTLVNFFLTVFIKNILHLKNEGGNNYVYIVFSGLILSQINIYLHTAFLLFYASLILAIINFRFLFRYWREFIVNVLILLILVLFLNAQWLLPVFSQAFIESSSVKDLIIYDPQLGWEQAKSISKNIFMLDLLKMKSYHVFENHSSYLNFFYFLPFGIVLFFLTKRRNDSDSYLQKTLIFLVISLFLAYGIRPVSEFFYMMLWEHLPFFTAFRTIFKFAFLYLYAIVFILVYILAKMQRGREYIIIASLLSLNVIFSMHYYFQPEVGGNLQQYVIPEYYFSLQAANLTKLNNKLGNNISSPQFNWQFQYEWSPEKIDGMNILPYFYGSGFFINGAQDSPDIQYIYNDFFDYNLRNNRLDTLKNLLSIRNIKFITYQDDLRVTDNESTPYIVKSNFEETPDYKSVITQKFISEICSRMLVFDKLSVCQVKRSLFTPLFRIKNVQPIEIKNEKYLADLKEGSYFIPYNKRDEKNYSQVNLVEENPVIVDDLMHLGVTDTHDVRLFETKIQEPIVDFVVKKSVYPSLKPFQVKNCYYQMQCSLFFFQNIEAGRYHIYFVRHLSPGKTIEDKEYFISVYDQASDDFIGQNVKNLQTKEDIEDYKGEKYSQLFGFISKRTNDIGEIDLVGSNIVIRTLSDDFFSKGTFYLVQNKENLKTNRSVAQIEFKKVNPTKYRVRIHNARETFPLVFAENYDKNWRIYSSQTLLSRINLSDSEKYVPLKGNGDDQATKEELTDFIKRGLVTDIGDLREKIREHKIRKNGKTIVSNIEKYQIDFISKNIDGTIQNDNLPDGKLWETWFTDSINGNESHFEDDGYSNGWLIDPQDVCKNNQGCIINTDGTVDFELVIEFWPQHLFYVGLGISVVVFLMCVTFILFSKNWISIIK